MNITLYDYLAYNVPSDCNYVLSRYDYPESVNEEQLVENLKDFVRNYNYEALDALAEIHPDYDLISELVEISTPYEGKKESEIEDRKDKRVRMEGTQQSQMIQQRANDGTPIDFESTNDSLGDFGLEAFGPK